MLRDNCKVRYLNREDNVNQVDNFSKWWQEQLNMFGTKVLYYTKGYSLSAEDPIYAEDFETAFETPQEIVVGANITNDASMLSKFGLVLDSDMTIYIHIEDFKAIFGDNAEPKSGDVIELVEVGFDRPGVRGSPKYVVTSRDDDDFPVGMNPLMAHFLWFLKLKRFEFSHEKGITPESGTGVVDDQGPLPSDVVDDLDPNQPTRPNTINTEVSTHTGTSKTYTSHEDEVYGNY